MININEKLQKIEDLTNNGYRLEISKYITDAYELFKKNAGGFVLYTLLIFGISAVLSFIPYHLGSLISILISAPLNIGFVIVARKIRRNEAYTFNDFFKGFDRFADLNAVYLCSVIFVIIGLVLLVLPGIYLALAYAFAYYFVWFFYDGSVMNTLERSRKLITKEWFSFFGFFLVILVLNIAGIICLGVGLLISIPVTSIALYLCFESLIGTEEEGDVS